MDANNTPERGEISHRRATGWLERTASLFGIRDREQNTEKQSPQQTRHALTTDSDKDLESAPPAVEGSYKPEDHAAREAEIEALKASNEELLQQVRLLEEKGEPFLETDPPSDTPVSEETVGRLKSANESLEERSRLLHRELTEVRAANTILQNELDSLRFTEERNSRALEETKRQVELARDQAAKAKENNQLLQGKLVDTRVKLTESRAKVVDSLKLTRERLVTTSALWSEARKYFALFRQGLLADEMAKTDANFAADTYVCLLPSTVPAALDLQRKYGGRIICDCVENVEVEKHSLAPRMHPPALDMVNLNAYGALSVVDGLMTVSHAVGKTLDRFGPPVRVHPNYRRHERPTPAGNLREMFQLDKDARVLITSGNIVKGFESVIDAIGLLPEDVHLVALAKFSPPEYDQQVRTYLLNSGMHDRVHLHEFVPYDQLSSLLADADAGIITLDPGNPNHSVSLPNRVFDFTTATLPFVVPKLSEIQAFVERYGVGVTINDISPESWASGILKVLNDMPNYKDAMRAAREEVTWESLDDGLVEFLGHPKTVTLLGFRDLSRYQRFLRMTDSLTSRGIGVKAVFFSENPAPIKNNDAQFYHFTDRYGRGPGLIEVPHEADETHGNDDQILSP